MMAGLAIIAAAAMMAAVILAALVFCRHGHRLKMKDAEGRLWLVCERCLHRVRLLPEDADWDAAVAAGRHRARRQA